MCSSRQVVVFIFGNLRLMRKARVCNRKKGSKATERETARLSCFPCSGDTRLRAGVLQLDRRGREQNNIQRRQGELRAQSKRARGRWSILSDSITRGEKMDYKSPTAGFSRADKRGISYLVDKRLHTTKTT